MTARDYALFMGFSNLVRGGLLLLLLGNGGGVSFFCPVSRLRTAYTAGSASASQVRAAGLEIKHKRALHCPEIRGRRPC